jgi:hypothetical protein
MMSRPQTSRRHRRGLLSPFTWAAIPLVIAMIVVSKLHKNAAIAQTAAPTAAPTTAPASTPLPAPDPLLAPADTTPGPIAALLPPAPAGHVFTPSTQPARAYPQQIVVPRNFVDFRGHHYLALSFDQLAAYRVRIHYVIDDADNMKLASQRVADQIPAPIAALNGEKVALLGVMFPLDIEGGKVSRFMLLQAIPGCLYCQPPALNEWIDVTASPAVDVTDKLVTVYGKLEVGEHEEEGVVASIYRMSCEAVAPAPQR